MKIGRAHKLSWTTRLCLFLLITGAWRAHAAEDHRVRIADAASSPIRYFYASNIDNPGWGQDILGPGVMIYVNQSMIINIDDGTDHCHYDLKAVLFDGRTAITKDFDVCSSSEWTVTDDQ